MSSSASNQAVSLRMPILQLGPLFMFLPEREPSYDLDTRQSSCITASGHGYGPRSAVVVY